MRPVYARAERVIQFSVLTLITLATGSLSNPTEECIAAAHEALDEHERCIEALRSCTDDAGALTKYINW